jgi:predicted amidohydrolase
MNRRAFIRNAAIGMGAVAGMDCGKAVAQKVDEEGRTHSKAGFKAGWGDGIGRPVRISSIGFKGGSLPLDRICTYVDQEGSQRPDIIVLPEQCRGLDKTSEESLDGPTVTAMIGLARKHKTYISCPIDRRQGELRLNSAVFIDRSGRIVSVYDKVFPYWTEFTDVHPPVAPGDAATVYQADFGRVGFATCFDINFPEVWRRLSDHGAEIVLWSSAYSGGVPLQAHALNHHYYIVTCTWTPDCIVYDITGERVLFESSKEGPNITRVTLDLDRGIYHSNFNLAGRDKLLQEKPGDVEQEKWMEPESWFVLRAKRPGVSARKLAHQYGLEELRDYIVRSRQAIDARRGWEFEESVVFPQKSMAELKDLASQTGIAKLLPHRSS